MTLDKGFWGPGDPVGQSIFGGTFGWPLLVARATAVERNIATLATYAERHGLAFAPHGKTTMSPTLFQAQLAAGAWGITVATAQQARVCREHGVPRVLVANQILDPAALAWVAAQTDAGFEIYFQVDSLEGVAAAAATTGVRPLPVLVEIGYAGGRTGCRSESAARAVANAVAASPRLTLAGVTGYEGGLPDQPAVAAFLDLLRTAAVELADLLPPSVIVSAGGSAWFDVVAARLPGDWLPGHQVVPVLRSGAYVTHDDGYYREHTPFNRVHGEGVLDAALELWAQVISTPEPGLAIAGVGKRDAPFDEGLPVPRAIHRSGSAVPADGLRVTRLMDQHAFLTVDGADVAPGDLVRFGISHPCTAFDKWRAIPLVDDSYVVVDVLRTYF
ncbi:amino acid deaminase [Phytohabitans flavus]|uniref:Amino acid deaminase n=1 Tax=Phytohabitans flavus TaxID=1076124 RepID=A0A6F8XTB9_9ACTN|nr:alanine racemase [Phytohabitans flavus]BCB77039.1 amino acid deaminase [Phytohabitans flavus]